ncbi:hypothetical protein BDD12DRAFT_897285 [Trichophaea hybrida]|nr:hypothetical protein BDD12DRAFT_897285 [Trichophaea hybrida]
MVANDLESRADNGTTVTYDDNGKIFGYRGLSNFLDSNPEFLVFRRFGRLSVRNILYLQDELCELQEQLDRRDDLSGNGGKYDDDELLSYSRTIDLGDASDRQGASEREKLAEAGNASGA